MRGNLHFPQSGGGFATLKLGSVSKSPDKDGIITYSNAELDSSHTHEKYIDRYTGGAILANIEFGNYNGHSYGVNDKITTGNRLHFHPGQEQSVFVSCCDWDSYWYPYGLIIHGEQSKNGPDYGAYVYASGDMISGTRFVINHNMRKSAIKNNTSTTGLFFKDPLKEFYVLGINNEDTAYGMDVWLAGVGNLYVGGGESALYASEKKWADSNSECLFLLADAAIHFYSRCDSGSKDNAFHGYFDSSGILHMPVFNTLNADMRCKGTRVAMVSNGSSALHVNMNWAY